MAYEIHVELYHNDPMALMGVSGTAKSLGGRIMERALKGEPGEDQRVSMVYSFDDPQAALSFKQQAMRQYNVALAVEETTSQPQEGKVLPVPGSKVRPRAQKQKLWRKVPWSTS